MVEIQNKQILIDGKPTLLMVGEIHYYRLKKEEWQDRIDKLKEAGCNAVATYVPWVIHESVEGDIDLEGRKRPEHDLEAYIDLCKENELYFFLRPGPFIMAEMKNEGIPFWVYEKHPEIIPIGWDDQPATTKTLDYMAPNFLKEVRKWYEAVMKITVPRLHTNGGNIIAIQLDNEIGMLSWVSNVPDLTDHVVGDFSKWLKNKYNRQTLTERYPFQLDNFEDASRGIRSPKENYAAELMKDLGYYMRNRFARFVQKLRSFAEEFGVRDTPFVVNIHGTGGGRGFTFPIGISQLYESYTQAPGYLSGSDIYFGDLDMNTFQDLYIINGFMDAVHNPNQPLTSVEFNCGDGNFGETFGGRTDPSAADFKTRMSIAQGHRLLNYYLFAGGRNYRMDESYEDGNGRIAFTGERHGFAAPVSPEGKLNYTFPRMARSIRTMMAVADKLAVMNEEHDDVSYGFIPDYFMTEYRYPKSKKMADIVQNLEVNRATGAWEIMFRAMLLANYRYGATDIQNKSIDPSLTPVLAIPSAKYMSREIQEKLVTYLQDGGKILLYGEVPTFDMEAQPCEVLAEALDVKVKGVKRDSQYYYLSVIGEQWAQSLPEIRTHFAQMYESETIEPLLRVYGTNEVCGFSTNVGKGKATVIGTAYKCNLEFFKNILSNLGAQPHLTHDYEDHGIFLTSNANQSGERFIHLLNLDGLDKEFYVKENGKTLFGGRKLQLFSKDGVMLPLNMTFEETTIIYSTAEVVHVSQDALSFRLTQSEDIIALKTNKKIVGSKDFLVLKEGDIFIIQSLKHAKVDSKLTIEFQ